MENQEKKDEGASCCGKSKCCGGKALAAVGLIALGGIGGYFAGKCRASKCAVPAAVEAPAATPAK